MAVKHKAIKPLRNAGIASQDRIYISGAAIVEGAPVVFSSGKVITASDGNDGPTSGILGFALHAVVGSNEDVLVALAMPGRRFVGSLGTNTAASQSDAGTNAIALADIGSAKGLHLDATTLKWILGDEASGACTCSALVDKVTATTNDTPGFGVSGSGSGIVGTVTPFTTFNGDPTGSNTGFGLVEFVVHTAASFFA